MLKTIVSTAGVVGIALLAIGFVVSVSGIKKDKLAISVIGCVIMTVGSIISAQQFM